MCVLSIYMCVCVVGAGVNFVVLFGALRIELSRVESKVKPRISSSLLSSLAPPTTPPPPPPHLPHNAQAHSLEPPHVLHQQRRVQRVRVVEIGLGPLCVWEVAQILVVRVVR
jgi:hypothetical protein